MGKSTYITAVELHTTLPTGTVQLTYPFMKLSSGLSIKLKSFQLNHKDRRWPPQGESFAHACICLALGTHHILYLLHFSELIQATIERQALFLYQIYRFKSILLQAREERTIARACSAANES
jgi:hypothetical protein